MTAHTSKFHVAAGIQSYARRCIKNGSVRNYFLNRRAQAVKDLAEKIAGKIAIDSSSDK